MVCSGCGKSFNRHSFDGDKCDECGAELHQRDDDKEEVIRERIKEYKQKTFPIQQYYESKGKLAKIDGNRKVEDVLSDVRKVLSDYRKTDSEIELMRQSGVIVGDALREVEKYVRPGVSTMELNSIVEDVIRSAGAIPSFLNYNGFPAASCISVDDVVVHGFPSLRVLKEGEIVSIDVGAVKTDFTVTQLVRLR